MHDLSLLYYYISVKRQFIPTASYGFFLPEFINHPTNASRIFFEKEMPNTRMFWGLNEDERWRDIYGNPSRGLFIEDKSDGTQLQLGIQGESYGGRKLYLGFIEKKPSRGILGYRFMQTLKKYCDLTKSPLEVVIVANTRYFSRFDWLKPAYGGISFVYQPAEEENSQDE